MKETLITSTLKAEIIFSKKLNCFVFFLQMCLLSCSNLYVANNQDCHAIATKLQVKDLLQHSNMLPKFTKNVVQHKQSIK